MAGQLPLEYQDFLLDALRVAEHGGAFAGQYQTFAGALKQCLPDCRFQGAQPPPHGGLGLASRRAADPSVPSRATARKTRKSLPSSMTVDPNRSA